MSTLVYKIYQLKRKDSYSYSCFILDSDWRHGCSNTRMHKSQQGRWTRNRYRYVALLHSHRNSIHTQKSPTSIVHDHDPLETPFIISNAAGGKPNTAKAIFEANKTARGRKFIPDAFRGRENKHIGITIRAPS